MRQRKYIKPDIKVRGLLLTSFMANTIGAPDMPWEEEEQAKSNTFFDSPFYDTQQGINEFDSTFE